jgi:hypothetical protein
MLEPQGFYDAITAYGLPSSIADLDRSAQAAVPYRIKTAYGFTDPFIVNGVTKQGGSLSPVKCMLTTSMCSRWLTDLASTKPGQLLMRSTQACRQQPHSSLDNLEQLITMIEAMDDSLLITTFLPLLLFLARPTDQFQAVYGWETEWLKSALYALYAPEFPPTSNQRTYPIPSVDYADPSSSTTFHNPVNVVTDFITFLRVPIDQPDLQFQHVQDLIFHFSFPAHSKPLPLTALRRLVSLKVISRLRPLLIRKSWRCRYDQAEFVSIGQSGC